MPVHAVDTGMSGDHVHSVISRRNRIGCDQHALPGLKSRTDIDAVLDCATLS